jgi:hypothetical protein
LRHAASTLAWKALETDLKKEKVQMDNPIMVAAWRSWLARKRQLDDRMAGVSSKYERLEELKETTRGMTNRYEQIARALLLREAQKIEEELGELKSGVPQAKLARDRESLTLLWEQQKNRPREGTRTSNFFVACSNAAGSEYKEMADISFPEACAVLGQGAQHAQALLLEQADHCPQCMQPMQCTVAFKSICARCKYMVDKSVLATMEQGEAVGAARGRRGRRGGSGYESTEHTRKRLLLIEGRCPKYLTRDLYVTMLTWLWARGAKKDELDGWVMRAMLSDLGLSKLYDYGNMLLTVIRGVSPPQFPTTTRSELSTMVHLIQKVWPDYQREFDKHVQQSALMSGRTQPSSKKNQSNSAMTLWRCLQMLGYTADKVKDSTDDLMRNFGDMARYVTCVYDRKNVANKDTVMGMVAEHFNWDMSGILFQGTREQHYWRNKAASIAARPAAPLSILGLRVTWRCAVCDPHPPWVLVLEVLVRDGGSGEEMSPELPPRQLVLAAGPWPSRDQCAVLRSDVGMHGDDGWEWDEPTKLAVQRLPPTLARKDLEPCLRHLQPWDCLVLDPTSDPWHQYVQSVVLLRMQAPPREVHLMREPKKRSTAVREPSAAPNAAADAQAGQTCEPGAGAGISVARIGGAHRVFPALHMVPLFPPHWCALRPWVFGAVAGPRMSVGSGTAARSRAAALQLPFLVFGPCPKEAVTSCVSLDGYGVSFATVDGVPWMFVPLLAKRRKGREPWGILRSFRSLFSVVNATFSVSAISRTSSGDQLEPVLGWLSPAALEVMSTPLGQEGSRENEDEEEEVEEEWMGGDADVRKRLLAKHSADWVAWLMSVRSQSPLRC